MRDILEKAIETHSLNKTEIIGLLNSRTDAGDLFAAADLVRRKFVGADVHLRGLIEFSNICKNNCLYCGLRRDNKALERYRIDKNTILALAKHAKSMGLKTVVLQSGEDVYFDIPKMTEIIAGIKSFGLALTLSTGEKSFREYEAYRKAGADRFLIRIETTDKKLYEENDPGMSWERRVQCMRDLKKLGYELGSGCLVGLPGQTTESLADDILFFKDMSCDMIGIGPFIPHHDTRYAGEKAGSVEMTLFLLSVIRILLPKVLLPATTALGTMDEYGREKGLLAGANVIMPNLSPEKNRKDYSLYDNKICTGEEAAQSIASLIKRVESVGCQVAVERGDALR